MAALLFALYSILSGGQ
jgi:hypothetical protein